MPSFAKATATVQPGRRMVHLLNYVAELRGKSEIIEDALPALGVNLLLRCDGGRRVKTFTAPDQSELPMTFSSGYVQVTIPDMRGYQLVVFEWSA